MTEPLEARPRGGRRTGPWMLIGVVVVIVAIVVAVLVWRDRGDPHPAAGRTSAATPASTTPTPVCAPEVRQSGFHAVRKVVDFGLIVTSACPQAAVNTVVTVRALDADGKSLPVSGGPDSSIDLPVLLPGQRTALGGKIFLAGAAPVRRLAIAVSRTQNIPATEFASWPRRVTVTGLQHTGPDAHGITDVSGTVTTDPPGATLCNPAFYLLLRDAENNIVYGQQATRRQPSFSGELPPGVDWNSAQISVVQGVPTLGSPSGATLSCRNP